VSHNTIWATQYRGAEGLEVIKVTDIASMVCVSPFPSREGVFFIAEKLGLEVTGLANPEEDQGA
jgi:hypothetical protein